MFAFLNLKKEDSGAIGRSRKVSSASPLNSEVIVRQAAWKNDQVVHVLDSESCLRLSNEMSESRSGIESEMDSITISWGKREKVTPGLA